VVYRRAALKTGIFLSDIRRISSLVITRSTIFTKIGAKPESESGMGGGSIFDVWGQRRVGQSQGHMGEGGKNRHMSLASMLPGDLSAARGERVNFIEAEL